MHSHSPQPFALLSEKVLTVILSTSVSINAELLTVSRITELIKVT